MTPSSRKHATANQPASSAIKRLCNCRRTGTASCLRAVEPDPIPVTVVRSRTEVGQPAQMLWDPRATRMSFFEHSGNYVISRQMPSESSGQRLPVAMSLRPSLKRCKSGRQRPCLSTPDWVLTKSSPLSEPAPPANELLALPPVDGSRLTSTSGLQA